MFPWNIYHWRAETYQSDEFHGGSLRSLHETVDQTFHFTALFLRATVQMIFDELVDEAGIGVEIMLIFHLSTGGGVHNSASVFRAICLRFFFGIQIRAKFERYLRNDPQDADAKLTGGGGASIAAAGLSCRFSHATAERERHCGGMQVCDRRCGATLSFVVILQ